MGKQVRKGSLRRRQERQLDQVKAALRKSKNKAGGNMDRQIEELATEVALADQQAAAFKRAWQAEKRLHEQTYKLLEIERRKARRGYLLGITHSFLVGVIVAAIYWAVSQ
jgi:hypothetical protein